MTSAEVSVVHRPIRFMAVNRAIAVGAAFASIILVAALGMMRTNGSDILVLAAAVGFVAGSIVGFSNLGPGASERDVAIDAMDASMAVIWTGVVLFAIALLSPRWAPQAIYSMFGSLLIATLVGSAVGVPVLRALSKLKVKGRRPFLYITEVTEKIENEDVRFVTRVVLQSVAFALLVALAFTVIAVVVILIVLYLVFTVLSKDGTGRRVVVKESREEEEPPRRAVKIPKHGYVDEKGKVMKEGLLYDTPTGQRVDASGRVLKEGLLTDQPTGQRIDSDGRVMREGLLYDSPTGVKLASDGEGGTKVAKDGYLGDVDTGMRISEEGRAQEKSVLGQRDASLEITPDGKVLGNGKERP